MNTAAKFRNLCHNNQVIFWMWLEVPNLEGNEVFSSSISVLCQQNIIKK